MNIYKNLNKLTKYIEEHLEEQIDYEVLAKFLGVNVYTMQRLFTIISNVSISEYIRKRRLSNVGFDLYNSNIKIIDLAIKYQYDNATSFSRAFEKFHGIKPSMVNKQTKLKNFPRIIFNENVDIVTELDYEIIELEEIELYGISITTNKNNIGKEAPLFFRNTEKKYFKKYGKIKYGMITYDSIRQEVQNYYCLYEQKINEFEHIKIPASKWLRFRINSRNSKEIQEKSQKFYQEFLPSCKYNLKELPELEYYHDNMADFLVAIH